MPLYIRDNEVDALAAELQAVSGAASKTEAVRTALLHKLERNRAKVPLAERLARLQARATEIGLPNRQFDMKRFSDEMWGDE
ncbi:type II toxin-antitoxin system VapB family antitoxin [Mesorhizobium sp. ANAO-SY3R2]|uniref:type II toxin-antitoxin system VapB family antitoxin n=1 Tax=Mesorhizobium sp. ANAO-SY3R2 TaxID=3166644 RepID=UPI00366AC2F5